MGSEHLALSIVQCRFKKSQNFGWKVLRITHFSAYKEGPSKMSLYSYKKCDTLSELICYLRKSLSDKILLPLPEGRQWFESFLSASTSSEKVHLPLLPLLLPHHWYYITTLLRERPKEIDLKTFPFSQKLNVRVLWYFELHNSIRAKQMTSQH